MGKGGGCVPSKKKISKSTLQNPPPPPPIPAAGEPDSDTNPAVDSLPATNTCKQLKLFIIFYSMYGHVESLAKRMKKGVEAVDGVDAVLYRVPETLSEEVLVQMRAPVKDDLIPELPSLAELADADGFLFGFPTRYGCMAAQMKAFFDSTGQLWKEQKLAGKPAGFFVSTGTQGGGQETTAWTAITQLAHHGMLFVPIGYTFGAGMFKMDSIRGGTPYGAGVFAGDGTREASDTELALAEHQGKYMAAVVKKLVQD
ncbi:putative NAD(P)H dehydrogenase (quinone) FQR1-like 2 [Capsicum baccatum]|nr:putative NAD(P)H dehydrogenase (quinone) FQR1-like 2 [Capsicum baccatum]